MNCRIMLRQGLAAGLVLLLGGSIATAPAAEAHVVYADGQTARNGDLCLWQKAEVSHGTIDPPRGSYFQAVSQAKRDYNSGGIILDCYYSRQVGPGVLTAQIQSYTTNPDASAPLLCQSSGPRENQTVTSIFRVFYDYGNTPCGTNNYRSRALGIDRTTDPFMQNYLFSGVPGTHLLPSNP